MQFRKALLTVLAVISLPTIAAETNVGWRGDGSGVYPDAHPPTTWSRSESGEKKNIVWETKLPCYTWSTPIIIGDKLITRSEPYDLVCMNKNTGKVLWIRSHPPIDNLTAEEKKANPAFAEIEPLVGQLQKINDGFVASGWTQELYNQKYELQKKINDLTGKADRKVKLPPDMWVESWSGYTAATPCSDGKLIYITSGSGVTAAYDLDGNKKWSHYESMTPVWGEHGQANSPALIGDTLIAQTTALVGYNKTTGAELWRTAGGGYSILPYKVNGVDYAIVGCNVIRVSDGKIVLPSPRDVGGNLPALHENTVYYTGGNAAFFKIDSNAGELKYTPLIQEEYNRVSFPIDDPSKKWEPMFNFYTASPIYHDGLLYCLSNWGKLVVVDTTKTKQADAIVYNKNLPFDFKNPKQRKTLGCGIGASPALVGKYIYMTDNAGCTLVIEPGREFKLVAKNNIDYTMPKGWEQNYWIEKYHEITLSTPIYEGGRMYLRGEQNFYCIGEK